MSRVVSQIAVVVAAIAVHSATASAQGWADDKGTLTLAATYAYQFSDSTYHDTSFLVSGVPSDTHQLNLKTEFVPLERLTAGVQLYSAATRYTGPQTGADPSIIVAHGSNDDGSYHYKVTDLEAEVRYAILNDRFGLSPAVRFQTPVTDYEVRGYAAHGSGLKEGGAGIYFSMSDAPIAKSHFLASYFYTIVAKEKNGGAATEAYSVNRHDAMVNWGYQITDDITASLGVSARLTPNGFNLRDMQMAPMEVQHWHDPILAKDYLMVNAIGAYTISDSLAAVLSIGIIPIGLNVSNAKLAGLTFIWTTDT